MGGDFFWRESLRGANSFVVESSEGFEAFGERNLEIWILLEVEF